MLLSELTDLSNLLRQEERSIFNYRADFYKPHTIRSPRFSKSLHYL